MILVLGSFTGIRIGIATAKAFHDSHNIPIVGIDSLYSLTYNIKYGNTEFSSSEYPYICSLIDCRNNNCYCALYKNYDEILKPDKCNIDDFLEKLDITNAIFVGSGAILYKEKILNKFANSVIAPQDLNSLNSYSLGLAGLYKYTLCGANFNYDLNIIY